MAEIDDAFYVIGAPLVNWPRKNTMPKMAPTHVGRMRLVNRVLRGGSFRHCNLNSVTEKRGFACG